MYMYDPEIHILHISNLTCIAILLHSLFCQVKQIENEAAEIAEGALSESELIVSMAEANSTAIVEQSRSNGLKHMYSELGITDQQHKASFDYLRTLKGQDKVFLSVDYQTNIAGPMVKNP